MPSRWRWGERAVIRRGCRACTVNTPSPAGAPWICQPCWLSGESANAERLKACRPKRSGGRRGKRMRSSGPSKRPLAGLKWRTNTWSSSAGASRSCTSPCQRPVTCTGGRLMTRPPSSTFTPSSATVTSSTGRAPASDCRGPTRSRPLSRLGTTLWAASSLRAFAPKRMSTVTASTIRHKSGRSAQRRRRRLPIRACWSGGACSSSIHTQSPGVAAVSAALGRINRPSHSALGA